MEGARGLTPGNSAINQNRGRFLGVYWIFRLVFLYFSNRHGHVQYVTHISFCIKRALGIRVDISPHTTLIHHANYKRFTYFTRCRAALIPFHYLWFSPLFPGSGLHLTIEVGTAQCPDAAAAALGVSDMSERVGAELFGSYFDRPRHFGDLRVRSGVGRSKISLLMNTLEMAMQSCLFLR